MHGASRKLTPGKVVSGAIDTDRFSRTMRDRILDAAKRRILITNHHGSAQEPDLTVPANCDGVGRIRHFRRDTPGGWPSNPLPIDPACRALGLPRTDMIEAQVFQNAACNWRCWYCFVPFDRLSGDQTRSVWLTADELVERYLAEPARPRIIDLTGGQPDLVPEWTVWMMDALEAVNLGDHVYLWSDDNLSNDYFFRHLSDSQRGRVASYRCYGRVGCFKGFNSTSFAFNTQADPSLFDRQFELMGRLLDAGLDMYAYVTLTSPSAPGMENDMACFVDRLQRLDERLPLRTVPLKIERFTPMHDRTSAPHEDALTFQEYVIEAWHAEIDRRFTATDRVLNITEAMVRRGFS
jgi:uncharacterized Fe-S cluster-containing radical SAM superfamily protein